MNSDMNSSNSAGRKSPGFTLIELLVVIAIIALLASFIIPGVMRAMRRSYQAACISNMQQTAIALQTYVDDHDQWLPPGYASPVGLLTGQKANYTKSSTNFLIYFIARHLDMPAPSSKEQIAKVFFCPGFKRYGPNVTTEKDRIDYALYSTGLSTNINFNPFGYPANQTGSTEKPNHRITEISNPSEVHILSDVDQVAVTDPNNTWQSQLPLEPVHLTTRNYIFFDNHVGQKPIGPPNRL